MGGSVRAVLWQGFFWPGAEWCELMREGAGWRLRGTVLAAVEERPVRVGYDVILDADWTTREVDVRMRRGVEGTERQLRLRADRERTWRIWREPGPPESAPDDAEALRGLVDIDLGFTPATNSLPIRRLAPAIGESVEATALWVRFPELTLEPLPQRYTRLGASRYRYESAGGAFVAELEVDELGLVVTYEGGWRRIATATAQTKEMS